MRKTINQKESFVCHLLLELFEWRQIEHRLLFPDVILGLVRQVLARRLQPIDFEINSEVKVELVDVD